MNIIFILLKIYTFLFTSSFLLSLVLFLISFFLSSFFSESSFLVSSFFSIGLLSTFVSLLDVVFEMVETSFFIISTFSKLFFSFVGLVDVVEVIDFEVETEFIVFDTIGVLVFETSDLDCSFVFILEVVVLVVVVEVVELDLVIS